MPNAPTRLDSRQGIERLGDPIDIINYSEGTESEHGETRGSSATVSTHGVINRPRGTRDPEESGVADVDIDLEVTIPDSIGGIEDGGGRVASEVDIDQDGEAEYRVAFAEDSAPGEIRLECVAIEGAVREIGPAQHSSFDATLDGRLL